MDVLLILPPVGPPEVYCKPENELGPNYKWKLRLTRVPQGLLSIGTVLYNLGYNVEIFDSRLHYTEGRKEFYRYLRSKVEKARLLIGMTVMTQMIPQVLRMIDTIKMVNPDIPIVLGGIHPTLYPEQTCKDSRVNFVIAGDGEYPMAELVQALDKKSSHENIRGLTHKENDFVKRNPVGRPFDIQRLGTPAYHILEVQHYLTKIPYYSEEKTIGIEYNSTRGCPYDCSFCVNRILPQNRVWRCKTADQVLDDLQTLKQRYKIKFLLLEEENPFTDIKRSFEIAKKLIENDLDIRYFGNIRVDNVVSTPRDVLKTMEKSGWCETSLGVESGSNRVLGYLRKGITVDQTIRAVKILNDLGVYALYSFMIFLPHETSRDRLLTHLLINRLKKIHRRSSVIGPQPYRPYPCSDLYMDCLNEGLIEPDTFQEWSNFVTNPLSPSDIPWVSDYSWMDRLLMYYHRLWMYYWEQGLAFCLRNICYDALNRTIWRTGVTAPESRYEF